MTGILRGQTWFLRPLTVVGVLAALCPPRCLESLAAEEVGGRFFRSYWYEPGIEHGNPFFNSRFRVNAPEAVLQPSFMNRSEVRGVVPVNPTILRRGPNGITVLSDTDHHGIEVLLPGPALVIRSRL